MDKQANNQPLNNLTTNKDPPHTHTQMKISSQKDKKQMIRQTNIIKINRQAKKDDENINRLTEYQSNRLTKIDYQMNRSKERKK